jgi:hypothetical protein
MASTPALAQASSAAPPGAPDTPMAPTSEPPDSTIRPPPIITTPGKLRMPACIMPGWLTAKDRSYCSGTSPRSRLCRRRSRAYGALRSGRAEPPAPHRSDRQQLPLLDNCVSDSPRAPPVQGPEQPQGARVLKQSVGLKLERQSRRQLFSANPWVAGHFVPQRPDRQRRQLLHTAPPWRRSLDPPKSDRGFKRYHRAADRSRVIRPLAAAVSDFSRLLCFCYEMPR